MEYASYEYYTDTYKGSMSTDLFSSYIVKASREIDRKINTILTEEIIEALTEKEQNDLQYTTCLLVDYMNINKDTSLKSLSIDGVSKTYKDNSTINQEKANIFDNLPQSLTRYI